MGLLAAPRANRPREVDARGLRVACVGRACFALASAAAASAASASTAATDPVPTPTVRTHLPSYPVGARWGFQALRSLAGISMIHEVAVFAGQGCCPRRSERR